MDNFRSKIAVAGGGAGMGRSCVFSLRKEGCAVAACDQAMDNLNETKALCNEVDSDIEVTHQCDVSREVDVNRLRDEAQLIAMR